MGEGGFEPPKSLTTDLQSAPFGRSGTLPYIKFCWSWWTDLNPRPADYKSAALPTELHQQLQRSISISRFETFVNTFFKIFLIFFKNFLFSKFCDFVEAFSYLISQGIAFSITYCDYKFNLFAFWHGERFDNLLIVEHSQNTG